VSVGLLWAYPELFLLLGWVLYELGLKFRLSGRVWSEKVSLIIRMALVWVGLC
jgi:hypothetical protein